MSYRINPDEYSNCFSLPSSVAEKHIKLSGATQLKVLILAIKNAPIGIDIDSISERLSISKADVADALNYWCSLGVLINDDGVLGATAKKPPEPRLKKVSARAAAKPNREEVVKRSRDDAQIEFLLREAQFRFGRPLRQSEIGSLVWLYSDEGLDPSILLMLISFAVSEDRGTIGFIERTAVSWINEGVLTVSDAERKIDRYFENKSAWASVEKIIGISHRKPSPTEEKLSHKWIFEFLYREDVITYAYNICVDATSKVSLKYMDKIITGWHEKGLKTLLSIHKSEEDAKKQSSTSSIAKYDMDEFLKSLDNIPD